MPTALDQQEQLNRILAPSVAPVYSYNQGLVDVARLDALDRARTQREHEEDALKMTLAQMGENAAMERTRVGVAGHIEAVKAQVEGYLNRLDAREKDSQLKTLQAMIPRQPGETDENFFARATIALPDILNQHDSNIKALQDQSVKLAQTSELAKETFAKNTAARAIIPLLDEKTQQAIQPLLASGRSIDVALAAVPSVTDFPIAGKHFASGLTAKERNNVRSTYDAAYEKALEKPQIPENISTQYRNTELELKRAIDAREAFTKAVPFALLGQQAKPVTPSLPPLDELRKAALGQTLAPAGGVGYSRPIGPAAPAVAPLEPGAVPVKGIIPSAVSAIEPLIPSASEIGSVLRPVARGAGNVAAAIFGGNVVPIAGSMPDADRAALAARLQNYQNVLSPANPTLLDRYGPGAVYNNLGMLPPTLLSPNTGSPDEDYLQQILAPAQ